jgi:succinate dehydrogenase flavin-adding protein (antitoxin of CptAB toxin-antitoxin module)
LPVLVLPDVGEETFPKEQNTNQERAARSFNSSITEQSPRKMAFWRWRGGLREIGLVLALYAAYSLTQGNLAKTQLEAFQNTYHVIDLEKYLHIFWELNIQSWFLRQSILIHLANDVYSFLFYPSLVIFAIWSYNYHHKQYLTARNVFLVSAAIGLFCFAFYPVAPPRMLTSLGFVDTLTRYEVIVRYSSAIPSFLVNQYAAMPSFHFGWTLLVGICTSVIGKSLWLKLIGALLPLLMFISILATGNHFILDAATGAIVIMSAYGTVVVFGRLRKKDKLQAAILVDKV